MNLTRGFWRDRHCFVILLDCHQSISKLPIWFILKHILFVARLNNVIAWWRLAFVVAWLFYSIILVSISQSDESKACWKYLKTDDEVDYVAMPFSANHMHLFKGVMTLQMSLFVNWWCLHNCGFDCLLSMLTCLLDRSRWPRHVLPVGTTPAAFVQRQCWCKNIGYIRIDILALFHRSCWPVYYQLSTIFSTFSYCVHWTWHHLRRQISTSAL